MNDSRPAGDGAITVGLRVLLFLAYPVLSHVASLRDSGAWAALALLSLVVLCLLVPLAQRRAWAWLSVLIAVPILIGIARSSFGWMLLLAPPVVFPLLVAWGFARSLLPGQTPLISRIVDALYQRAAMPMTRALQRYTRRLTAAWAIVLTSLAGLNLALAMSAVPNGLLAAFGIQPWWPLSHEQWSWCANVADWGLIGGFFVLEYVVRGWIFPQRPYRNVFEFMRQMGQLGPKFWRELLR